MDTVATGTNDLGRTAVAVEVSAATAATHINPTRVRRRYPCLAIGLILFHFLALGDIAQDDLHRWGRPRALWRARQLQPLLPRAVISFEQKEIEAARYGIDLRHPFADRELIEFLITLPCAIKSDPMRAKPVLVDALASVLPASIHSRRKSDYMAALRQRISPARCAQVIQTSNVRLPHIDYVRLFADCDVHAESIPLHFLVNLARLHHFARRVA